jgi:CIC family chloride channel protein
MDGDLMGTIEIGQVSRIPRNDWALTRVTDVMSRGAALVTLTEPQSLMDAVGRFEESGLSAIPVVDREDGRRLVGIVTRDGLFRAIRHRAALRA